MLSQEALFNAVGSVPLALINVDQNGHILNANGAAEVLFRSGDVLRRKDDHLTSPDPDAAETLRTLIAAVVEKGQHCDLMAAIKRPGKLPVLVLATIFAAEPWSITLFISDPNAPAQLSDQALRTVFHLSASEARLCKLLAQGLTLQECAATMRLTVQSARTYLKDVFRKTGARRQCDLVHLLLSSPCFLSARLWPGLRRIEGVSSKFSPHGD